MKGMIWRAATLIAWATFFVWLLVSGEVYRYIGPRTQWVVVFGAVSLVLASAGSLWMRRSDRSSDAVAGIVMLLPIIAVLVVPKPTLGSLAASRKLSGGPALVIQPGPPAAGGAVSFREIEYASASEEYAATSGISDGTDVELTGFVTEPREATADFGVTRFSIFCCAADVVPHSVDVDADRSFATDTWITVHGVLERRNGTFIVVARSTERVSEPEDPYIR